MDNQWGKTENQVIDPNIERNLVDDKGIIFLSVWTKQAF